MAGWTLNGVGHLSKAIDALHSQGGHGEEKALSTSVGDVADGMSPIVPELTKTNRMVETFKQGLADREGRHWVSWKKIHWKSTYPA